MVFKKRPLTNLEFFNTNTNIQVGHNRMFNYDKVVMGCNISPCLVQMIMADVLQCIDIDCVYIDDILFSQQNKTLNEDYGSQQIPMTDRMKNCPPFLTKTSGNPTCFDDQY